MFHAFALQGPKNSGKSTTLLQLYNELKSNYPTATIKYIRNNANDISVIISGIDGEIIGIDSRGDQSSRLQSSLNAFVAAKCTIIFCACLTKGITIMQIKTLPLKYKIHFVEHTRNTTNNGASSASTAASLMRQAGI